MKSRLGSLLIVIAFAVAILFVCGNRAAAQGTAAASVSGKVYKFDKIADGVYYASSSGPMATGGNHIIVVNERDVLLVDSGETPMAGRALLDDMKLLTDKPVRTVINTHFHYDHTDGNSIFGPEVEIIAQDYVRHAILDLDVLHREPFTTSIGNLLAPIEPLKKQVAEEKDPAKRAELQVRLTALLADQKELQHIKPTPPTTTYSTKMTLYRGPREIRLLFLGRGHTQGDTVVYLPKERVVCTGDLMESRVAYMGDGVFDEWIKTLDAIKELDFDTVLPGHGAPFHGKDLITAWQSYLRDLTAQVAALRKQGVSAEEAAKKVDLTSHASDFPDIKGPGADLRGVRRMYEWMDEKGKQ